MKMVRILLVSLSVSMTACSRVDHYTEAMSHGMEEDSLQHYYSARYGSKPQNRGYLSDDYFDITLEEPKEEPKEEPRKHSVTQQVKKAMLASTKQKKTPVPRLASKPSVQSEQSVHSVQSEDYFDNTFVLEEPRKPSFTQQVKKAKLASTNQKKPPVPRLVSKPSVVVQQQQTQATTTPPVSAKTLAIFQDPASVLSRILYHMARL